MPFKRAPSCATGPHYCVRTRNIRNGCLPVKPKRSIECPRLPCYQATNAFINKYLKLSANKIKRPHPFGCGLHKQYRYFLDTHEIIRTAFAAEVSLLAVHDDRRRGVGHFKRVSGHFAGRDLLAVLNFDVLFIRREHGGFMRNVLRHRRHLVRAFYGTRIVREVVACITNLLVRGLVIHDKLLAIRNSVHHAILNLVNVGIEVALVTAGILGGGRSASHRGIRRTFAHAAGRP